MTNLVYAHFKKRHQTSPGRDAGKMVYSRSPLSRIPDSWRERMQESTNSKPVVSSSSMSFCPSAVKEEKRMTKREKKMDVDVAWM